MNIKNLFLLLLLLTGFAACSGDKEDIDDIANGESVLTVNLQAAGGYSTRAENNATAFPGESKINNYSILIYNGEGTDLLRNISGTSANVVRVEKLSAGRVNVVAFANLSDAVKEAVGKCSSISALQAVVETFDGQSGTNLTMGSIEPTTAVLAVGDNTIEVTMTRLVSRIQVSSIKTNFKIAHDYTVTINDLQLLQVNEESLLYSNKDVAVSGCSQQDVVMTNKPDQKGWTISNTGLLKIITDGSIPGAGGVAMPYGYVFENIDGKVPTQLLLNATLKDNNGKEVSTRNFKVTVHGTASDGHQYVKRNYIYDLGLSFEDTSFDMAALVVKVTVVPWGKVKQVSEVD